MEVGTSITPNSNEYQAPVNINVTDCNIGTLVIGDRNSVCDCSRRLELEKVVSIEVKPLAIFTSRGRDRSGRSSLREQPVFSDLASCAGLVKNEPTKPAALTGYGRSGSKRIRKQRTIQFVQRKRKTDSKSRSSDSEEEIARLCSPEVFPTVLGDEKSLKKFYGIVNQLHPLRDSGNWEEFEMVAKRIQLERKGDLASEIFILLEKSVAVSYHKDFERSEAMVFKGLKMLKQANLDEHHFLVSTAYINLTGLSRRQNKHARRQNKHGEAQRSLETARQNATHVKSKSLSKYLQAIVFYEWASNLNAYISLLPSSKPSRASLVENAKDLMKQCISLCVQIDSESVYFRKHHFGLPKLALMSLNCPTRLARSELVDLSTIQDAQNCIKILEDRYKEDLSQGATIQLLVAKSDLCFRLEDFPTAEKDAMLALETANKFGFSLEVDPIKERLEDISRLIRLNEEGRIASEPRQFENSNASMSSSTSPSRKNYPSSSDCEIQEL